MKSESSCIRLQHNSDLVDCSRTLRRNMTFEEVKLWKDYLKLLPVTVKRQKVFGRYILDFYIPCAKLAIELDGRQHQIEENRNADALRDQELKENGICVLRYPNRAIHKEFAWVCKDIERHVEERTAGR